MRSLTTYPSATADGTDCVQVKLYLDRVSTGSGSDLVSDQHLTPMVDQVATAPCTDPIQE